MTAVGGTMAPVERDSTCLSYSCLMRIGRSEEHSTMGPEAGDDCRCGGRERCGASSRMKSDCVVRSGPGSERVREDGDGNGRGESGVGAWRAEVMVGRGAFCRLRMEDFE
jgi:hypothetical protein